MVKEFKRFLQLAALSPDQSSKENYEAPTREELIPSPLVDRLWRVVLVDSQKYRRMCERVLGCFLHRSSKTMFKLENYKRTILLYR